MPLDRAQIAQLLPHAGAMSLLDEVLQCDPQAIVCRCDSHRRPDHPMRSEHGLGSAAGIEYAAQAMALHGALTAAQASAVPSAFLSAVPSALPSVRPHGVLASVRGVRLNVARLDDIQDDLIVSVRLDSGDALSAIYTFSIAAGPRELVSGRASVMFIAPGHHG